MNTLCTTSSAGRSSPTSRIRLIVDNEGNSGTPVDGLDGDFTTVLVVVVFVVNEDEVDFTREDEEVVVVIVVVVVDLAVEEIEDEDELV